MRMNSGTPIENGDLHNFGRHVKTIIVSGSTYFAKPRPVFWEQLYFGITSPLAKIFSPDEFKFLFNLEINQASDLMSGNSKKVEHLNSNFLETGMREFGILLGYCFVFGLMDLHQGNIIASKNGLQVIDAEVVGFKMLLPSESLLIPFRQIGEDACGFAMISRRFSDLRQDQKLNLLAGYFFAMDFFREKQTELSNTLRNILKKYSNVPVRVILRDTESYRNIRPSDLVPEILPEEQVQLARGDIPYFFKFYGDERVYYYTTADGEFEECELPEGHLKIVASRTATNPDILLSTERLNTELDGTGGLYLIKRLFADSEFRTQIGNRLIQIDKGLVALETAQSRFESKIITRQRT